DYWFVVENRRVHKTVHHFLMTAVGGELSDEDIEVTEVAWVPLVDLERRLAYADERRLARRAMRLLGPNGSGRARDTATGTVDEAELA
ncbi:MAG TPA: NUDIX hydrolase, partial [Pseudonocardiaceae bacterium]